MRRRIVLTNVVVTLVALSLFIVLVVWASATRVVVTQRDFARVDADRIAVGLDARLAAGDPVTPDSLAGFVRSDASAEVVLADGRAFVLGQRSRDQRVLARSNVVGPAVVTVHTKGDSFTSATVRIGAVLVLIGLLVVLVAALVARRLANSLVEPVGDLALVAARLGTGDPRPSRRRYGIAELDAVAEVLDASAERIGAQVEAERQLATDISHQLRTPLTALSMRLEEVIATDDPEVSRAEATIALQQAERLSRVVDDVLAFSRQGLGSRARVDVDAVLDQQLQEWSGAYTAQGRSIERTGDRGLEAWLSSSVLSQVVATLIENALVHGRGVTSVRTRTSGSTVVVEVADDGDGVPPDLARTVFDRDVSGASRSGLGLALARALIESEGGRLELIHPRPATFAIFLVVPPRAPES